ncbi:MAG: hypothetical protein PHF97_01465 [Bacteroidales bacterium]|nr:hypothetical protein [Bacteroidales bacterium]MDD4602458.1 hypothetical protein [Bacteroidales bacterium]
MKKQVLFFILVMVSGIIMVSSCKQTDPIFGTLTVTVYDPIAGTVVPNEEVYLATSFYNLSHGAYLRTAWTNAGGAVYFGELAPGFYYYDTKDWEDFGAVMIYAGNDFYVHLYVNTPATVKK